MTSLRPLATVVLLLIAAVMVGCTDAKREANFNEFLETHDPALKAKRDEMVAAINGIREKRTHLRQLRTNYHSEAALARLDALIGQADARLAQLEGALTTIDEKIEFAMIPPRSRPCRRRRPQHPGSRRTRRIRPRTSQPSQPATRHHGKPGNGQ